MEAVNCKLKPANRLFQLFSNTPDYSNFTWTKKAVIIDVKIWIIETYYSWLKSQQILLVILNYLVNF